MLRHATITAVMTKGESPEVPALRLGALAVHSSPEGRYSSIYSVTHAPSGRRILKPVEGLDVALVWLLLLRELGDWEPGLPEGVTEEQVAATRDEAIRLVRDTR